MCPYDLQCWSAPTDFLWNVSLIVFLLNLCVFFSLYKLFMSFCHINYYIEIPFCFSAVIITEDSQDTNWQNSATECDHRWYFSTVASWWRLRWICSSIRGNWSFIIINQSKDTYAQIFTFFSCWSWNIIFGYWI
jgi:hypothetical protein